MSLLSNGRNTGYIIEHLVVLKKVDQKKNAKTKEKPTITKHYKLYPT